VENLKGPIARRAPTGVRLSESQVKAAAVVGTILEVKKARDGVQPGYYVNAGRCASSPITFERAKAVCEGVRGEISGVNNLAEFQQKYASLHHVDGNGYDCYNAWYFGVCPLSLTCAFTSGCLSEQALAHVQDCSHAQAVCVLQQGNASLHDALASLDGALEELPMPQKPGRKRSRGARFKPSPEEEAEEAAAQAAATRARTEEKRAAAAKDAAAKVSQLASIPLGRTAAVALAKARPALALRVAAERSARKAAKSAAKCADKVSEAAAKAPAAKAPAAKARLPAAKARRERAPPSPPSSGAAAAASAASALAQLARRGIGGPNSAASDPSVRGSGRVAGRHRS
jgi:hypothetical protein